jgi:lysine 2,3-aminomutase
MKRDLERLYRADRALSDILLTSASVETCRQRFYRHLQERETELRFGDGPSQPIDRALARQCLQILKNLVTPRNEVLAGFSTLEAVRTLVREPEFVDEQHGLLLEFVHLVEGMRGRSGMAAGWTGGETLASADTAAEAVGSKAVAGRAAGRARSDSLDRLAARMWDEVDRFPNGLDPALIARREQNRDRILAFFGATLADWEDPRWQLRHLFVGPRALSQLDELVTLSSRERDAIRLAVEQGIPFGITPYYLSLFDAESADRSTDRQVRAQVLPPLHYVHEMMQHEDDRDTAFDFMGEHDTSPIDLVTRRYPAVAILKGYDTCPQICVYCQRNWEITGPMDPAAMPSRESLDAALDWFAAHTELREVLITGGDPLFLSDARIEALLDRFAGMDHILQIRIGTRALVTMPMRVTEALASILGRFIEPGRRNVTVVTHVQSAAEVTPEMATAVHRLRKHGLSVYNQQVFTTQTSRRFQTVANRIALKRIGVDPYYTFYPKGKDETRGYGTPLARILQERKEEARLLPGSFRTDEPVFNVPRLGKNHVRATQDRELIAVRPDGRRVYLWHPWEKGIAEVAPWLYEDHAILGYLQALERMGEDPRDYRSIWYYY